MLYDVKSSVFFFTRALWLRTRLSHVYNLISGKETATTAVPLDFLIFKFAFFCLYSSPFIVVLVMKVHWKKKIRCEVTTVFYYSRKCQYLLREKKIRSALFFDQFFTSYFFVAFALSLCLVSILLVFSWPGQVCVPNCSPRGFSGILGKFLRVNLHLFWYGGRGRVASEERVGESQT